MYIRCISNNHNWNSKLVSDNLFQWNTLFPFLKQRSFLSTHFQLDVLNRHGNRMQDEQLLQSSVPPNVLLSFMQQPMLYFKQNLAFLFNTTFNVFSANSLMKFIILTQISLFSVKFSMHNVHISYNYDTFPFFSYQ